MESVAHTEAFVQHKCNLTILNIYDPGDGGYFIVIVHIIVVDLAL